MLADRQTHTQTDKQTDRNTPLPYGGGVTKPSTVVERPIKSE